MKVAWIGLGQMGLPTARTVAAAGFAVKAYDIKPLTAEETAGLTMVSSLREAAEGCDVVCVALFSDDQVEEVLAGPEGIFPILKESAVVAIFTTGTIASAKALAASAPPAIAVLDTCFSRQSWMMESGKLNILAGGDAAALDRCRPVLQSFAHEIFHMGGSGTGRAIKLVNNLQWVANHRLARDTLDFAEKLGLDPLRTAEIILKCSGATDAFHVYLKPDWQKMVDFMHPYYIKDASAAAEAASDVGCDLGALRDVVRAYTEDFAAAERDEEIAGKPPRIAPVEEFTDDMRDLLQPPPGATPNPRSKPHMTTMLLHHAELLRRYNPFMTYFLFHGTLTPRDRELAIMRAAWLNRVPFIWGEHVRYARDVGMTDEEIESVTQGSQAPIWNRHDRAVVRAAEELVGEFMISDETWAVLAETLSEKQLIELVACVGQYQTLGNLQNSLRISLWDGNPGLTAR